jgi:hypothetical protein
VIEQPSATTCYCSAREGAIGRPLDLCADDMAWMRANSPRIAHAWRFVFYVWSHPWMALTDQTDADAMEENRLGFFLARRFLNG